MNQQKCSFPSSAVPCSACVLQTQQQLAARFLTAIPTHIIAAMTTLRGPDGAVVQVTFLATPRQSMTTALAWWAEGLPCTSY